MPAQHNPSKEAMHKVMVALMTHFKSAMDHGACAVHEHAWAGCLPVGG